MIRSFGAALLGLAWLPPPPSSAEDLAVARRPAFHLGDSFTYAERFETVACRTWLVTQIDADGNMLAARCGENTAFFAPDGGITRILGANNKGSWSPSSRKRRRSPSR